MSGDIGKTPDLANGMLVGAAVVGFPLIRGAFNAADQLVDVVRRSNLHSSVPVESRKASRFAKIIRQTVEEAQSQLSRTEHAETLNTGLVHLEERATWLTAENIRQVLENNRQVDVFQIRLEIAKWLVEPLLEAMSTLASRDQSVIGGLRRIRMQLVKQSSLLLDADLAWHMDEPSYGLRSLVRGVIRKTLIVLLSIPLAGLLIWTLISIHQVFS